MRIRNRVLDLSTTRRTALLLIFGICVFILSCNGSQITWSAEARSPDGKMIATARTIENSGFGTGAIWTGVYLNWSTGSGAPTEILELAEGPKGPADAVVEMKWLSPTHLELILKGTRKSIGFQAIKWVDVDISVRDVSDPVPKTEGTAH